MCMLWQTGLQIQSIFNWVLLNSAPITENVHCNFISIDIKPLLNNLIILGALFQLKIILCQNILILKLLRQI